MKSYEVKDGVVLNHVVADKFGNIYGVGTDDDNHAYIAKYQKNGEYIDCSLEASSSYFTKMIFDNNGGIICVGYIINNPIDELAFIVRFDSNLYATVSGTYGAEKESNRFLDAAVRANGNIVCVGYSRGLDSHDGLAVEYDANLNVIDEIQFGRDDNQLTEFSAVAIDNNNQIITISTSECDNDVTRNVLIKFGENMSIIENELFDGILARFKCIDIDSANNIYLFGNEIHHKTGQNIGVVIKVSNTFEVSNKINIHRSHAGNLSYGEVGKDDSILCTGWASDPIRGSLCGTVYATITNRLSTPLNSTVTTKQHYYDTAKYLCMDTAIDNEGNIIVIAMVDAAGCKFELLKF